MESSVVAAKLLKGGRRAHAAFNIPVPCGEEDMCYISVIFEDAQKL